MDESIGNCALMKKSYPDLTHLTRFKLKKKQKRIKIKGKLYNCKKVD